MSIGIGVREATKVVSITGEPTPVSSVSAASVPTYGPRPVLMSAPRSAESAATRRMSMQRRWSDRAAEYTSRTGPQSLWSDVLSMALDFIPDCGIGHASLVQKIRCMAVTTHDSARAAITQGRFLADKKEDCTLRCLLTLAPPCAGCPHMSTSVGPYPQLLVRRLWSNEHWERCLRWSSSGFAHVQLPPPN
jgi:hypothetical protein